MVDTTRSSSNLIARDRIHHHKVYRRFGASSDLKKIRRIVLLILDDDGLVPVEGVGYRVLLRVQDGLAGLWGFDYVVF